MKSFARIFWLTLGLSLAGLMTGCVSTDRRTAQRIEPANDFEVVETSARRPLTGREMGELRGTVARYLEQQGATDSGDYYLKVYLTPEAEGVTPEWVVVRFTRYSDVRVNVASTYPAYDDPYSSSYYSYDTYPYGYGGFGRISFQYYDDPFYGRRYYYPRHDHRDRDHDRDHHKPGDRPPGGQPPGGVGSNPPTRPNNPRRPADRIAPTAPRPETATRARDDINGGAPGRPVNAATPTRPPSRSPEPDRQWRSRNENGGTANAPRPPAPPRAEARNDAPRASPPVSRSPDRVAPSSSSSSNDRREVRDDGKKSNNLP